MFLSDAPGLIPGWGPVIADLARQIALDPDAPLRWKFDIYDDHGRLLAQRETTRRPTATEKSFIAARDQLCRYPGCRKAAQTCDDDHCRDYAKGGASHRSNLAVLCRAHHTLKHDHGLDYHISVGGTVYWYFPDGRIFFVPPEGLPWFIGDDLDNAPPIHRINHYIPHTRVEPGTRPVPAA